MKKMLFAVGIWLAVCAIAEAGQDMFGSPRPAVWRSSRTASTDTNVNIGSTTIIFHSLVVSSPSAAGSGGAVLIIDATDFTLPNLTTAAIITTNAGEPQKEYNIVLSTGLLYNKIGGADVNILYDFLIGNPSGRR